MIVVQTSTSNLPSTKSTMTFSSSASPIWPWPIATRVAGGRASGADLLGLARLAIVLGTRLWT